MLIEVIKEILVAFGIFGLFIVAVLKTVWNFAQYFPFDDEEEEL